MSYLPVFAAVNLLWETLHLQLYTFWHDEDRGARVFALLQGNGDAGRPRRWTAVTAA